MSIHACVHAAGCRGKQPRLRARRTRTSATIPLRSLTTERESDSLGATPSVKCAGDLCRGGARRAWVTGISCHRFSHCHTPCISCPSVALASLRNTHFGTLLISDNTIGFIDFQPFLFLFLFLFVFFSFRSLMEENLPQWLKRMTFVWWFGFVVINSWGEFDWWKETCFYKLFQGVGTRGTFAWVVCVFLVFFFFYILFLFKV